MFVEVCNSDAEAVIVKLAKRTDCCSGERSLVNLGYLH